MEFYFGTELLQKLKTYYESRLSLALSRGFDHSSDRYHWLFVELEHRVTILRRLITLIDSLPGFLCNQDKYQIMSLVASCTMDWFSSKNTSEMTLHIDADSPYWADYMSSMDRFTAEYNYEDLSAFYLDIVESLVMALRLYFHIRETQLRPIDSEKYDNLVSMQTALSKPA